MDNSEASTTEDEITEEVRNVRVFATQMLKQKTFVGCFKERQRVDTINEYRDVIVVDDSDLKKDLDIVKRRLRDVYKNCWIGITGPDYGRASYGHCLWVTPDASENYILGSYIYQIKGVKFRKNEIIVRVKHLRALVDINITQNSANESIEMQLTEYYQNFSFEKTIDSIKKSFFEYAIWFFTTILTKNNIKDAINLLFVLIVTSAAFSYQSIVFLMNYSLKLMRELSYLVQSCTPVMLSIVDLFAKIIGGFYILIASIYRDMRTPQPRQPLPPSYMQYKPIDYTRYRPRSSLTIKEIN